MSLKKAYENFFTIGAAVSAKNMASEHAKQEIQKHYNSLTAENEMKPMYILDRLANTENPEVYDLKPVLCFDKARKYLEFAKASGISMRGHTLLWHNQTPPWFFKKDYSMNQEAPLADRKTMLARMENYIRGVLTFVQTEYPGVIYAWDVVNEVIDESEEDGWRKSLWFQTVGDDFVLQAFRFARKYATAGVKLFYNDYSTFIPAKRDWICKSILKPLMEEKLIDGMGMQSHMDLHKTDLEEYEKSLYCFGSMGLEIHATELDIHNTEPSEESMKNLAAMYEKLFCILVKAKGDGKANVTNVTFWGMKDDESWLTGFRRERSYPLLFGDDYKPKEAYYAVMRAADRSKDFES